MLERVRLLFAAAVLSILVPMGAAALTISISPNPRTYSDGDDTGTITLVGTATGVPVGGTVVAGTVGATDISLIFQVTVTAGSVESLGVGVLDTSPFGGVSSTGAGRIAGPDTDVTTVTGTAGTRIFDFDADGQLDVGQTSDLFFISYASLQDDETQVVNFMVNGETGTDFTVSATLVPEPALLACLGLGLGILLLSRRRSAH